MMSEQLMKQFRVQVTTTMDMVLRTAVFEVMTIFENALHDHQMEMAQKGEEVAQLKIKLQAAELRLKDLEPSDHRVETAQTQTESEVVADASRPTSEVPEIDVAVPDDWCAPLGCEVVIKEEDGVCPSVRLRQFSIPLWHIPISKQESDINFKYTSGGRRPQRVSALNANAKLVRGRKSAASGLGNQCIPMRDNMLQDMTYGDLTGLGACITTEKSKQMKENPAEHKEEQSTALQPECDKVPTVKNNKNKYSCKFCSKVFDTEYDKKAHALSHNQCRGCQKVLRFPSYLKNHKKVCSKFRKLLVKEASNTPKLSNDEESGPSAFGGQLIKTASEQSSSSVRETSNKELSCQYCNCTFNLHAKLEEHVRSHSHEQWHSCSICSKKFISLPSLRVHMTRKHKNHSSSININCDFEWTKPLEDNDNENHSISPRKAVNKVRSRRAYLVDWRKMGTVCPEGFKCNSCEKILTRKNILVEHFRIHTGEKPLSCKMCPATFRYKTALYNHRKKVHFSKDSNSV